MYEKNIFSLNGDGERYHIFEYKSNNEINNLPFWQDGPNNYVQIKIAKVLNNLKVDKKYFPDFKQNYKYYFVERYDHSKLYLIYDSKKKRIYIIEEIM